MTDRLRAAAQAALDVLFRAGEELRWQSIGQVERELRAALASDHSRGATEMIDDRLRIERLVRANARRAMVIDIIERLVEDPEREDFGPSDMEYWNPLHDALREKLRAALAEQETEPVYAFRRKGVSDDFVTCSKARHDELSSKPRLFETAIFYTAPPRREWKGLTDEEIADAIRPLCLSEEVVRSLIKCSMDEYRAIEAALKEKNDG